MFLFIVCHSGRAYFHKHVSLLETSISLIFLVCLTRLHVMRLAALQTISLGITSSESGAYERREGASNCRTLFVPSSVESRALNLAENVPYKVSSMFAPTSLRSQQVAIIQQAGSWESILVTVVTSKLVNTSNL